MLNADLSYEEGHKARGLLLLSSRAPSRVRMGSLMTAVIQ
jgi:hypothetical protein